MEEDWTCETGIMSSESSQSAESAQKGMWNASKLRGFGRGKKVSNTNDSLADGPGKADGILAEQNGSLDERGWIDDDAWDNNSLRFGKPAGGFGKQSGGSKRLGEDNWDYTPSTNGFGGRTGGAVGGRSVGFGGNKKGGNGCHKCGEEGHFARECPNGGGGFEKGTGGKSCHKCGEEGHFARDCPNGGGGGFGGAGGRTKGCHKCGEEGHFARDCTNADSANGGRGFGIGGSGSGGGGGRFGAPTKAGDRFGGGRGGWKGGFGSSVASDKSEDNHRGGGFGQRDGGGTFGTARGGFGSFTNEGSQRGGGFGRGGGGDGRDSSAPRGGGGSGCRKCGEEGHFARDCPNGGAGGGGGKGGACHKCGEEGHFARECPKAQAGGEKPREVYVPPVLDDTALFNEGVHQGINFDKYDNIEVEVTGNKKEAPVRSFEEAKLLPALLKNVQRAGYTKPTPIQKHAIPNIMAGRDIMGCAQTGSGKTAAFILPVLTAMVKEGVTSNTMLEMKEPQTIVVAPTRELADQIYKEARKFSMNTEVRPVVVYGGVAVGYQLRQVEMGANLVVGTPGRLLDFIERGKIGLGKVKYLILDEADRMLDMGFEPSIRKLVDSLGMPPKSERQTLLFSATFKPDIQRLAADFMNDYLFITVGIVGGACTDVEQIFLEVDRLQKREYLCDLLNVAGTNRVLVFVGQKRNADFLASFLSQSGYPTTTIHGDRLQREREEALRDFKTGKSPVLIATNVAARGLDIPDVTHVVNYDLPQDIDEYVHRIGRTGRCGNLGKATSFYNHDTDSALAGSLVKMLSEARQEVPEWLEEYATSVGGSGGGFTGHFASKDIRRKKFQNGDGFATGGANTGFGGHEANYGGSYNSTVPVLDDEVWD